MFKNKHYYLAIPFCLIIAFVLLSCSNSGGNGGDGGDPEKSKWTIMVYLDGDNNLEEDALIDVNEMELANLNVDYIDILVLIDRCDGYSTADGDWKGTRLYKIKMDSDSNTINSTRLSDPTYLNLTDVGDNEELNMGDPDTVTKFIDFCKASYPADRYALVFWNHGGGWRDKRELGWRNVFERNELENPFPEMGSKSLDFWGAKPSRESIRKAVCWDDTSMGDCLYMKEVKSAITGKGIDLIGFDACLMGMVEVAYELSTNAQYLVASEETEPLEGWDYQHALTTFSQGVNRSPENLGRAIIDAYIDNSTENYLTLSLIDLKNMDNLVARINGFVTGLNATSTDTICKARGKTLFFYTLHYIDIYDFAENLPAVTGSSELRAEIDKTVVYHREKDYPDSHGLAIYYPCYSSFDSEYSDYNSMVIDFPGASTWDDFLADYYTGVTLYTIETFPNSGLGSIDTDTVLILYSSEGSFIYLNDDIGVDNYFSRIVIPMAIDELYYILVVGYGGDTGPYSILVNQGGGGSSIGNPLEDAYEPNDDATSAKPIGYNEVQDHYLSSGDQDWLWLKITIP